MPAPNHIRWGVRPRALSHRGATGAAVGTAVHPPLDAVEYVCRRPQPVLFSGSKRLQVEHGVTEQVWRESVRWMM